MTRRVAALALALVGMCVLAVTWGAGVAHAEPTSTTSTTTSSVPPPIVVPNLDGSTPTTIETPDPQTDDGSGSPGFFDIAGRVRQAVNGWFRSLVQDALNPVLDLLSRTLLATPDLTGAGRVRDLWMVSWAIANTTFVLLIVAAAVGAMTADSVSGRYAVKDLVPRIAFAWVAANASLAVTGICIQLANALSNAFMTGGVGAALGAAGTVQLMIDSALSGGGIFLTLIALAVVVLAIGLAVTYLARMATLVVLVAAAPLLLACHALPATENAARLWWRGLIGCLGVQVAQSLVLITAVRVFFDTDGRRMLGLPGGGLADMLIVACLFWLLLKLPSFARHLVFQPRADVAATVIRQQVAGRAIRAAAGAVFA